MKEKKLTEIVRIRELPGAEILDSVNCSYITERFFSRSRAWMAQRLNNNLVNGKPASFTPEELLILRNALKTIAVDLTKFTTQIPNIPTAMSTKVYVIDDPELIDFIVNSDPEGFKAYLDASKDSDDFLLLPEPESFDTEAEAVAFCTGIGFGTSGTTVPDRFPLRTSEPADLPFIDAIESY